MAISRVQNANNATAGATSLKVTLGSTPTSGNMLVAVIATNGVTTGEVTSITQTNITWSRATQVANASGDTLEIWYADIGAAAGKQATINLALSLGAAGVVIEYSGLAPIATALDKSATNTGDWASANPSTGTTAQTSYLNELWIGGVCDTTGGTFTSPTNSFSIVDQGLSSLVIGVAALEKIVTTRGTAASGAVHTVVPISGAWCGGIITLSDPSFNQGNQDAFFLVFN